ncbi:MAG: hypothetical protein AAF384_05760 [Pseudomonadota bacterium]
MAWWSFHGIHAGPWFRDAATNEPIYGTVFSFFELQDALISHYRVWLHAALDPPVVFDSSNPKL